MRLPAMSRPGFHVLLIGALLFPKVALSDVIYRYNESACSSIVLPGPCSSEGRWLLSDDALDDGVATGASEILGFNFRIYAPFRGSAWNIGELLYGPLSNIRLHGDDQMLTLFETISPAGNRIEFSYGSGDDSLSVHSSGGSANIDLSGPDVSFVVTQGQWTASAAVPLPASLWLFLSGLGGLKLLGRRRRS